MNINFTRIPCLCHLSGIVKAGLLIILITGKINPVFADESIWKDVTKAAMNGTGKNYIVPQKFRSLSFDMAKLKTYLSQAPVEVLGNSYPKHFIFTFPMPDGSNQKFYVVESSIMEPALEAKFPEIKTYTGQGIDDPTATVRFDCTPAGFHAMILSASGSAFIDPYFFQETTYYISYDKKDYIPSRLLPACSVGKESPVDIITEQEELKPVFQPVLTPVANKSIGTQLRTYSLALAATGEYTTFHGGTVAGALAAMTTSVNRVVGIYEREVAVRMILVANTNLLIYTNSSLDPYDNANIGNMLAQNQSTVTSVIGSNNYDIGHVFSTSPGGGIAGLGVVCNSSQKAKGATGSPSPVADAYDVDYVAHEMGHQFGGNHTFNCVTGACSINTRVASAAYEPGSGSTIMAYAGICAPNDLQLHSDAMFHTKSFDEITNFVQTGGGSSSNCVTITATGNNPPVINPGGNYTIPYSTPFKLTGFGSDPDGDTITYCWEEYDLGSACTWNVPAGNAPAFRSYLPTLNPTRLFPKLAKILNPTLVVKGEILPSYARTMKFKLTCRDNRLAGGGVTNTDTPVQIDVINTGTPFAITSPNTTGISYPTSSLQTITWNVGGTDVAPISTPNVNIFLSIDGGQTFPISLGGNVPNTGSYQWWTTPTPISQGRIWVEGAGNAFFDINDQNFSIVVGVEENDLSKSINVYPNPGNELFAFAMENNYYGKVKVVVFDKLGKQVSEQFENKQTKSFNCRLNAQQLESGMYFVEFSFDNGKAVKRLIKL